MSMEITDVKYNPDPDHIVIIRTDTSSVDCANPIDPKAWLDGTLGETVCVYDNQYFNFEKALCDSVPIYDDVETILFKGKECTACGILNQSMCCLNTMPINSHAVKDDGDNCLPAP